ncbi:hypothetical protein DGWBC_0321 [Dehalogenimonas sp. WBC-2]|nr:hypothetical protein DGWBC_0321 [Dehalogenimonas sp. WBC-2]
MLTQEWWGVNGVLELFWGLFSTTRPLTHRLCLKSATQ